MQFVFRDGQRKVCYVDFSCVVIIVVGKIYFNLEVNRFLENNQCFGDIYINDVLFSEVVCKRFMGLLVDVVL